ncbi:TRAP transporter substrate-binding protein [Marispirochaeta sp.]|uniref:TRAP transporter substrate-binding protein n=1 Tax=Marispirochaeta sp. TaxID=2038653 RepID=UPI0029C992AD|nr:TRAP transporter substrate-binding protein [Marispirochaeta sp.]
MNRTRSVLFVLTMLVLCFGLIVNGWSAGSQEGGEAKPVKLQLSHQMAATHSIHQTTLRFAELVEQKSGGAITVEVFPSASLGTERENLEALKVGTLDMAILAVEFYPAFVEEAGVFVLPFMYNSYEHQTRALHGDAGKKLAEIILAKTDVKVLSYYSLAFRHVFTTREPVRSVQDLRGLKIRVPESPTYVNTFRLLGAAPTPVAWGETYTALQTGVVGGLENTPESIYSASMHEVVKYMNITDHISAPTTFSISNSVYQKLSAEQQAILIECAEEASAYGLELTIRNDSEFRKKLAAIIEIIETDKESLRDAINYDAFDVMRLSDAKELKNLIDSVR